MAGAGVDHATAVKSHVRESPLDVAADGRFNRLVLFLLYDLEPERPIELYQREEHAEAAFAQVLADEPSFVGLIELRGLAPYRTTQKPAAN